MTTLKAEAHVRCFAGCSGRLPLTLAEPRCATCHGLLEVVHDEDALAARPAAEWRELFDARAGAGLGLDGSGVWGFREWVLPGIAPAHVVTLGEGKTPLVHAARYGAAIGLPDLYVKQCGTSHSGSFKDLGMTVLVSAVVSGQAAGALTARAVACASTGDTSAALAAYGAAAGVPVVVLLPRGKVSTAQLVQPLAHGAKVLAIDTDFDGCMALVSELSRRGLVYLANSMNPLRIEGQKTVAFELARQLGWSVPDWVVLPSGNLGNAAALHAGFGMLHRLGLVDRTPRLCVAQAAAANPMVRAFREGARTVTPVKAGDTLASAIRIGAPVSAPRAVAALEAMRGVAEDATEAELAAEADRADRSGLYVCPHTAVALVAARKLRERGVIASSDRVVVVSTANALKFTELKVATHEGTLPRGVGDGVSPNRPLEIACDLDAVVGALAL
ncbi:MAG TPA: threonine synthase [Polyangiaceae bacterium]|nr:threonine synthase [Polyangiaceae bacterium]